MLFVESSAALDSADVYTDRVVAVTFRTGDDIASPQVIYEQGGTNSGLNLHIENGYLFLGVWSGTNWGPAWVSNAVARGAQYTAQLILEGADGLLTGVVNGQTIGTSSAAGPLEGSADGVGIGGIRGATRLVDGTTGAQGTNGFAGWISEVMLLGAREDLVDYQKVWGGAGTFGTSAQGVGPGAEAQGDRGWAGGAWGGLTGPAGPITTIPAPHHETSCGVALKWRYWAERSAATSVTPIALNIDDDNKNGVADMLDTAAVPGEDNLVPLTMKLGPLSITEGTLTLTCDAGADSIVVWENRERGTPAQRVTLPKVWNLQTADFPQHFTTADGSWVSRPDYFWVECTNRAGPIHFTLEYKYQTPAPDNVNITATDYATALPVALIPDFNHDRQIDDTDVSLLATNGPFRFWINDDDDDSFSAVDGDDWPGRGMWADWKDYKVDGLRDLVDFFPLFLDIRATINALGTTNYKYILKHEAWAVQALVDTGLTTNTVKSYLVDTSWCEAHSNAVLQDISSSGYALPTDFLDGITAGTNGIVLLEGCLTSTKPLVLEVRKKTGNALMCRVEMPLKLSSVTNMFRYLNLRQVAGDTLGNGGTTHTNDPQNNPDSLSNGKNLVFIHGFNESADEGLGNICETFKRLYWSGSKAKYSGVAWYGDKKTRGIAGILPASVHYHWDVTNAFATAPYFASYVSNLVGDVSVIAFSLGNMVVSSAIEDHGCSPKNYFMLHAAMALEAYDASEKNTGSNTNMVQQEWRSYTNRLYASEWHALFPTNDGRYQLSWAGRFSSVVSNNVYNFYSSGEDVLKNLSNGLPSLSAIWSMLTKYQYAWCAQELWKGRIWNLPSCWIYGGSDYGGWGFTSATNYYTNSVRFAAARAALITSNELMSTPFFDSDSPFPNVLAEPTNAVGTGSRYATNNLSMLLADAIPAVSFATGANKLKSLDLSGTRNFDMDALYKNGWPAERTSGWYGGGWLHGDYRAVAYVYVYEVFDKFTGLGDLK